MDTPHNAEDHIDIFQDLDVGLGELFHRRLYGDMFAGIPDDQPLRRLDRLLHIIVDRQREENLSHLRNYWGHVFVGPVPLPTFNYSRFWHEYIPRTRGAVREKVMRLGSYIIIALRVAFFLVLTGHHIQNMLWLILHHGSHITFSDNFVKDAATFLFHDSSSLLQRRTELFFNEDDIFYPVNSPEYENYSRLKLIMEVVLNWISTSLNVTCVRSKTEASCHLIKESLAFRFADVWHNNFPSLDYTSWWSLKSVTMLSFTTYVAVGILVCLNVYLFFFINLVSTQSRFARFLVNSVKLCWKYFYQIM